jgi:hypothetical protein
MADCRVERAARASRTSSGSSRAARRMVSSLSRREPRRALAVNWAWIRAACWLYGLPKVRICVGSTLYSTRTSPFGSRNG